MGDDKVGHKTYYDLLGVPRNASADEIKRAYHRIARIYHPDMHSDQELETLKNLELSKTRKFKILTFAYNTLMDPDRRAEYDASLLPEWEQGSRGEGLRMQPVSKTASPAYGVFGSMMPAQEEIDALFADDYSLEPVCNMLRRNYGWRFWEKLLSFLTRRVSGFR